MNSASVKEQIEFILDYIAFKESKGETVKLYDLENKQFDDEVLELIANTSKLLQMFKDTSDERFSEIVNGLLTLNITPKPKRTVVQDTSCGYSSRSSYRGC